MRETERTTLERIRGCMVGGAVGDALGYAVEFKSWSMNWGVAGWP